ncbi:MAG: hypothetical protein QM753_19890 [Thermomicrobiales bacterium]
MESSASFTAHASPRPFTPPPLSDADTARIIAEQLSVHEREMRRIASELDAIRDLKDSFGVMRREAYASVRDLTEPTPTIESAWAEVAVGLAANRNPEMPLDPATKALITDILDSTLTNVAQHATASETNLSVKVEGRWIFVSVFDDGCGGAAVRPGHSLAMLQARVNAMQGHFSISSPVERGTLLTVALPVASGDDSGKEAVR